MIFEIISCISKKKIKPLARLIMWWEEKNYSHMAMRYKSETGRMMYLDSTGDDVSERNSNAFHEDYRIVKIQPVNLPVSYLEFRAWYEQHAGKKYPILQLVAIAFKARGLMNGRDQMTCNELIADFANHFGELGLEDIDLMGLRETEIAIDRLIAKVRR